MRFGDGIDFPDFKMPFRDNFMRKSEALGGVDSDDDDWNRGLDLPCLDRHCGDAIVQFVYQASK